MNKLLIAMSLILILFTSSILASTNYNSDNPNDLDDSNSKIPKTCSLWYDGCNECKVIDGKVTSCTKKYCIVQNPSKCIEYTTPSSTVQKGCKSWFDGCNKCSLMEDGSYACTEMGCTTYKEPKCMDNSDSKPSSECKLFYDGCNTCLYDKDNEPGKCTDRACIRYETPKCMDDTYRNPTKETGPVNIPKEESEKEKYLCSGCESDDKCYPFGYRKSGNFCSDNYKFMPQSEAEVSCENNFECSSNLCISNKCVSPSLIEKVLNWFKGIFE